MKKSIAIMAVALVALTASSVMAAPEIIQVFGAPGSTVGPSGTTNPLI